jgi:quercetin dioxygenase-like cupin family protein
MTTDIHQGIIHVPAGEGQTVAIGPGSTIIKLTSADTGNTMAVWEGIVPPDFGSPPLHAIPQAETFYLLEGEMTFTGVNQDGPYTFQSQHGAVVHIPGGTPFQFVNGGARPARVLTIAMPGGLDRFLAEFAAALPPGVPPDVAMADPAVREKVAALDARYGAGYLHTDDPATLDRDRHIVHVLAEAGTKVSVGRATNTIKLTSADTAGALSLIEGRFPPGTGSPPLHTHPEAETVVLIEGAVMFTIITADSPYTFTLRPGGVAHVPPRTPHQFTVVGTEIARGIVAVTPGDFERYIAEMGTATRPDGSRDVERLREIAARYGVEYVRLPGR